MFNFIRHKIINNKLKWAYETIQRNDFASIALQTSPLFVVSAPSTDDRNENASIVHAPSGEFHHSSPTDSLQAWENEKILLCAKS